MVVGRLQVELVDLLVQRAVLVDGDGEHGAQRRSLRAEELEVLLDALDHAFELGAALVAVPVGQAVARELRAPEERADRRRVRLRVDLHQPVEGVGERGHARRARARALLGGVEEQFDRERLGLAADELLERRVEAGDRDVGDLRLLVEGEAGRVVLHVERVSEPLASKTLNFALRRSGIGSPTASRRVAARRSSGVSRSSFSCPAATAARPSSARSTASTMRSNVSGVSNASPSTASTVVCSSSIRTSMP